MPELEKTTVNVDPNAVGSRIMLPNRIKATLKQHGYTEYLLQSNERIFVLKQATMDIPDVVLHFLWGDRRYAHFILNEIESESVETVPPVEDDIVPETEDESPVEDDIVLETEDESPVEDDIVPETEDESPVEDDIVPETKDESPVEDDIVPETEDESPVEDDIVLETEDESIFDFWERTDIEDANLHGDEGLKAYADYHEIHLTEKLVNGVRNEILEWFDGNQ